MVSVESDGKSANIILEEVVYYERGNQRDSNRDNRRQQKLNSDGETSKVQRVHKEDKMDVRGVPEGNTKENNGQRAGVSGLSSGSGVNSRKETDIEYARSDIRPDSPAQRWDAERIKNTERDEDKPPLSLSEIVAKIKHDFGIFGINITVGHVRGEGVRGEAAVFRECTIVMCFCVKI